MAAKINEKDNKTKNYGEKTVRTVLNSKTKKMYFCVRDVILAVTNLKDSKDYLKKIRKRDTGLAEKWDTIIKFLPYKTTGGVQYLKFADVAGCTRIIQTISKARTVPFVKWMEKQQKAAAK